MASTGAAPASQDPNDDSGILRYVSIRHGGSILGAANEINGLTMGAVGAGTTIEYIEVYNNLDDGYEWFGGTVNCKYLISAFVEDDDFDYDEGFSGNLQFLFAIKDPVLGGGRVGEHDGAPSNNIAGLPRAIPVFSNVTYVGAFAGAGGSNPANPAGDGDEMIIFRDNAGGKYYNSIFTECNSAQAVDDGFLTFEQVDPATEPEDSEDRLLAGDIEFTNNLFWNVEAAAGNTQAGVAPQAFATPIIFAAGTNNQVVDPQLANIDYTSGAAMDPRPQAAAAQGTNYSATALQSNFFCVVDYKGAFDPSAPLWTNLWTAFWAESVSSAANATFSQDISADWNLLSSPGAFATSVTTASGDINTASADLYSNLIAGTLFEFAGGFSSADSLTFGSGYWARFPGAEVVANGPAAPVASKSLALAADWNIIGSISYPIAVSDIVDPGSVIIPGTVFQFAGGFTVADSIRPGQAYWVRTNGAGSISLALPTVVPGALNKVAPFNEIKGYPVLTVADASGAAQELIFGAELSADEKLSYSLPPAAPAGFDARFVGDYRVAGENDAVINVRSQNFPLTLSAANLASGAVYTVAAVQANGEVVNYDLKEGADVVISEASSLILGKVERVGGIVPSEFEVAQNYPNPFNPPPALNMRFLPTSGIRDCIQRSWPES